MDADANDHVQLITNFKEVCAVDDELAERFLRLNDWNLENAVHHFFHNEGHLDNNAEAEQNASNSERELRRRHVDNNGPSTSSAGAPPATASASSGSGTAGELQRTAPPQIGWLDWIVGLFRLPFVLTYHSIMEILLFFWSLFRTPALAVADSRADVHSFVENFRQKYGDRPVHVDWFDAPYNDVLIECKRSLRFLLIYLHSPSHDACDRFIVDCLLTRPMREFIDRNEVMLWGASVRTQEGYKVSMALRENTYPFLGLLCMREQHMVMVLRLEGDYELNTLLFSLQTAVDENRHYLNVIREERDQRERNSRIRREQEAEYERGLAADRAKQDEKRKVEIERKEAAERQKEEQRRRELKQKKFDEKRAEVIGKLKEESDSADPVRVSVRFPCGARFERKFDPDESLEELFNATLAHANCPRNFTLVSSYPRRHLDCAPLWYRAMNDDETNEAEQREIATFRAYGFEKSVVVLVQDNDA